MASALLQGFVVGFAIAASPGPVFFLCVRRTLSRGWLSGAVSGLGVATADAFYGALAGFGVGAATSLLVSHSRWIQLFGGGLLVVLGVRALRSAPSLVEAVPKSSHAGDYLSVLALTLSNPPTILAFAAVFAGLGLIAGPAGAGLLVAGVFAGSAAWWLLLASLVSGLRRRVDRAVARAIGLVSGLAMVGFGLAAIGFNLLR